MSDDQCITETKFHLRPCWIGEDDQPACEYKVTECGMSLVGAPRNATTERFFQAAAKTGHAEIFLKKLRRE